MDYQGEIAPVNLALYCLSFTYEVSAEVYVQVSCKANGDRNQ